MLLQALLDLLSVFDVPFRKWGEGGSRPSEELFKEIEQGECELRVDKHGLRRVTRIVKMHLEHPRDSNKHLIEIGEYPVGGGYQERMTEPSGQIRVEETPEECLEREMHEELGLKSSDYKASLLKVEEEVKQSQSYPGLETLYVLYRFDIGLYRGVLPEWKFTKRLSDGTRIDFDWV